MQTMNFRDAAPKQIKKLYKHMKCKNNQTSNKLNYNKLMWCYGCAIMLSCIRPLYTTPLCRSLSGRQRATRLFNDIKINKMINFMQFDFAPLNVSIDIAMLSLIHKMVTIQDHSIFNIFEILFPTNAIPMYDITNIKQVSATSNRQRTQLKTFQRSRQCLHKHVKT